MSTWSITPDAVPAASGMRSVVSAAPWAARVAGADSVHTTLGNPNFGTDITVARVRDAKQAAPPRGELR